MQVEHDMFVDMKNSAMILEKVKLDRYAQNLYAAMCNMQWQKSDVWPVLKNELWSVSWRSSGGLVAELRGEGDYLSWYCSGMGGVGVYDYLEDTSRMESDGYVTESHITDEIRADLATLGWHPVPWEND
jgi:hypothetical protein